MCPTNAWYYLAIYNRELQLLRQNYNRTLERTYNWASKYIRILQSISIAVLLTSHGFGLFTPHVHMLLLRSLRFCIRCCIATIPAEGEPKVILGILPATLINSSYKTVVELVFFYLRKEDFRQCTTSHLHYREQDCRHTVMTKTETAIYTTEPREKQRHNNKKRERKLDRQGHYYHG